VITQRQKAARAPGAAAPSPEQVNGLVALYTQGRLKELLKRGKVLARKYPNAIIVHNLVGAANAGLGRLPEAIAAYTQALQISPTSAEVHNNLGLTLKQTGKYEDAIASFTKALELAPNSAEAHLNLCTIYDELNREADLESALQTALRSGLANNAYILLLRAKSSSRRKNFEETLSVLNSVSLEELPLKDQRAYFHLLGLSYDSLALYDKAFAQFESQNDIAKTMMPARTDPQAYFDRILELEQSWGGAGTVDWSATSAEAEDISLAFLIGFPRSGTTLLDTVLLGHPQITVVEEKPMVARMRDQLGGDPSVEELSDMTVSDILRLRKAYLEELRRQVGDLDLDRLVVDKQPMNIRHVGFIHRVFPQAKFVLALRHPCDCVLSCFMQNFILNDAMANFLNLEQSARLYAAIMQLWKLYTTKLNLDLYTVKYEDLVRDLRGTMAPLIEFLGQRWDDRVIDFEETAQARGLIPTPSYEQVARPLYEHASGRWKNYRQQLGPVLALLEPWIEEFGYSDRAVELP
jgi:tetratricopeptide (TPR) repeat protein